MKTLSKKLQDVLFGRSDLEGGTPIVAGMSYPQLDGTRKNINWAGNEGLIIHLIKRIEALEAKKK